MSDISSYYSFLLKKIVLMNFEKNNANLLTYQCSNILSKET